MTPLSPARKAAEEFAGVVDGTRGDVADRYADLLTFVDVLREQEPPAPRPDFVANLRERLMTAADTLLVPADDAPQLAPVISFTDRAKARQRRLSIAAAAFVVVGGTAGVAAAAESSLPGDPLYPLKRGIESAQISFNSSDSGKGQDLLRLASTRLDEVDSLLKADKSAGRIASTLGAYQKSATDGADLIFVSYQRNGDPEDISRLRAILGSQLALLNELSDHSPADVRDAFADSKAVIGDLDQQARVLCSDCGPEGNQFDDAVSAPALVELLAAPAENVQAAAQADKDAALANRADDIAKHTPALPEGPATPSTPSTPGVPNTPRVPLPTPGPVTETVGGVTNGVAELLEQLTKPLTETLGGTLGTVTKGLLPPAE